MSRQPFSIFSFLARGVISPRGAIKIIRVSNRNRSRDSKKKWEKVGCASAWKIGIGGGVWDCFSSIFSNSCVRLTLPQDCSSVPGAIRSHSKKF